MLYLNFIALIQVQVALKFTAQQEMVWNSTV